MQDINGMVLGVQGRTTRNNKTAYDVQVSDGRTYTTFKNDLASRAQALAGQPVTLRVDVKQNGQYTNYNLEDVAPQGQLAPMAAPMQPGTPIGFPMQAPPVAQVGAYAPPTPMGVMAPIQVTAAPQNDYARDYSPATQARITKLALLDTAAHLVGSIFTGAGPEALAEAEEHVDRIARKLYGAVMGQNVTVTTAAPVEIPSTPAEMAAVINAELGAPGAVQVGVSGLPTEGGVKW